MNEILIIIEFVMVIVVRGQNFQELLERISSLNEESLDDLKELIEGTLAPITDDDIDLISRASTVFNQSFKQDMMRQFE